MNAKPLIRVLPMPFTVCQVSDYKQVDLENEFVFTGCTDEEISLVCPSEIVPENTISREDGWRAFRLQGTLDFSLIGILADIAGILAAQSISIFALSTYNTDYILVKEENLEPAVQALEANGYVIFKLTNA